MSRRPIDSEPIANSEGSVPRALFLMAIPFAIVLPGQAEHESLGGPDRHETSIFRRDHLLGDWGGLRPRLEESGVNSVLGKPLVQPVRLEEV